MEEKCVMEKLEQVCKEGRRLRSVEEEKYKGLILTGEVFSPVSSWPFCVTGVGGGGRLNFAISE